MFRVDVDPNNRGMSYTSTPTVTLVAATEALTYDAGSGHGTYGFDQSTLGLGGSPSLATRYRGTSNYDVGHGAFPGHPGNTNLGHPDADCVYFMYSDIYVSPSGSDSTGQGTAGRPYRTIQKCIDASLAGARDYYVYKKADGGDRDPAVPAPAPGSVETAGERVDATGEGEHAHRVRRGVHRARRAARREPRHGVAAPENGGFVRRRELERRFARRAERFRVRREPRPVRFEGWDVLGRGKPRAAAARAHGGGVGGERAGGHAGLRREVRRAQRLRRQARERTFSPPGAYYQGRGDAAARCARTGANYRSPPGPAGVRARRATPRGRRAGGSHGCHPQQQQCSRGQRAR